MHQRRSGRWCCVRLLGSHSVEGGAAGRASTGAANGGGGAQCEYGDGDSRSAGRGVDESDLELLDSGS